jgi:hypothetical protein
MEPLTAESRAPNCADDDPYLHAAHLTHANRFRLDGIVAVSRIGFEQDARVWLAGSANSEIQEITGAVFGAAGEPDRGTTAIVNGRWDMSFTDGGAMLRRSNCMVNIRADADGAGIGGFNVRFH